MFLNLNLYLNIIDSIQNCCDSFRKTKKNFAHQWIYSVWLKAWKYDIAFYAAPDGCHRTSLMITRVQCINSLAPGRCGCNLKWVIFKLISRIDIVIISSEIAHRWMPWGLADDLPILVQIMACCCQATSHYLNQYWPSSMTLYGITGP